MLIKNIWTEFREYPPLNVKLLPGETADISSFTSQQIADCQELQSDFTRGYCVCIGQGGGGASVKDAFLREARNRSLGIERSETKIEGKKRRPLPEITAPSKKTINMAESEKPKYKQVFKAREQTEEEIQQKKLITVDSKQGQVSISPTTKGTVIDLEPFIESIKTRDHYTLPVPKKNDTEVQEILENIKGKQFDITPLCHGVGKTGRSCNKRAVRGYIHCINHMAEEEKIDYDNKKRGSKFGVTENKEETND